MDLETFFSIREQTVQFLLSALLGAGFGTVFDCFRVIRIVIPKMGKKAALIVGDILFMLICGAALFLFSVRFCRSSVRFFCIFGSLLGFILYIVTIGNFVTGIIKLIVSVIYGILQKVYSAFFARFVNFEKRICPKNLNIFVHSYENQKK